jgi:tight adherence protein B
MDSLLAIGVFVVVFTAINFAVRSRGTFGAGRKDVQKRLGSMSSSEKDEGISILRESKPEEGDVVFALFPTRLVQALQHAIWQAGMVMRVSELMLIVATAVCAGLGVGTYLFGGHLIPVAFGVGAGALPLAYLRFKRQRRLKAFNQQLPHVLDLIKSSLEAGHSLLRALQVVVSEFGDPISGELRIVTEQARIGLPLQRALENMTERIPDEDLGLLTVAVTVQSEVGSSLAQIVGRLSELVRVRQRLQLQIHAMTSQSRLSGIIVGLLPVIVLAMFSLIRPGYFTEIVRDPVGMMILKAAFVLDVIAICSIRYLLKVRY